MDPVVFRHVGQEIKTGVTFPIGLAYMGAVLLKRGYDVKILDPIAEYIPVQKIYQYAEWADAVFVPFSALHSEDIKAFRDDFRNKFFILGGALAKHYPEMLLNNGFCDVIIAGEGDAIIGELINSYPDIENVRGIIYKEDNNRIITTPSTFVMNLDGLPYPARHLLNVKLYWELPFFSQPTAWILSSRGCSYNCLFCTRIRGPLRFRSVEGVIAEIESVIDEFGIRNFAFFDDNFNLNGEFVIALCKEMIRKKLKVKWSCSARADLFTKEMARVMKEAGCVEVKVGLESANDEILNYFNKDTTLKKIRVGLEILKKTGLNYSLQCIFGSPMETRDTVENTIKFVRKYKPLFVSFNILTPLPGSRLFEELRDKITFDQVKNFDIIHTTYPLGQYSVNELRRILKKAYLSYYLSFIYLTRIFKVLIKYPYLFLGIFKTIIKQFFYIYTSIIKERKNNENR
ncbi:B12-binding domain-containing radical SAM protein [bacterium]|nr:B12-binding domain-containing radical SAM protein [bacterium]